MKKISVKLVCLALTFCMLFGALASCKDNSGEDSDTSGAASELVLVSDGKSNVKVIYPMEKTSTEQKVVNQIISLVSSLTGVTLESSDDYVAMGEAHDDSAVEILVGKTNYTQTESVLAQTAYGDYNVCVVGNKLVIAALSDEAMEKALGDVKELIRTSVNENKELIIKSDVSISGTGLSSLNALPRYSTEAIPTLVDCGDDTKMLVFDKADADAYDTYLASLETAGFEQKQARNILIEDNRYSLYATDKWTVTALYIKAIKQIRVIVESIENDAYVNTDMSGGAKICDPLLLQVGIGANEGTNDNGMSYIFRLPDGRFVIYDGGWDDSIIKNNQNATRILELLKEYAPDANDITIAAWLVTHAHTDHIGAINYFINNYLSKVTLERVIVNLPSDLQASQVTSGSLKDNMRQYRLTLKQAKSAGVDICKAHPGQVYDFGNDAKMEILYTYELSAPAPLTNFNDSSIVSKMIIGGQTFMMTGDTSTVANRLMNSIYGKAMQCDFLQVPHHGCGPTDATFYSNVTPSYVLWPYSTSGYNEMKSQAYNSYFFNSSSGIKGIYVAAFKTTLFMLPFNGTGETATDNKTINT